MDNPFIFNGYAGAQSFCDREKELEMLVNFAESGINTLRHWSQCQSTHIIIQVGGYIFFVGHETLCV